RGTRWRDGGGTEGGLLLVLQAFEELGHFRVVLPSARKLLDGCLPDVFVFIIARAVLEQRQRLRIVLPAARKLLQGCPPDVAVFIIARAVLEQRQRLRFVLPAAR